jgi:hypothetical protein
MKNLIFTLTFITFLTLIFSACGSVDGNTHDNFFGDFQNLQGDWENTNGEVKISKCNYAGCFDQYIVTFNVESLLVKGDIIIDNTYPIKIYYPSDSSSYIRLFNTTTRDGPNVLVCEIIEKGYYKNPIYFYK